MIKHCLPVTFFILPLHSVYHTPDIIRMDTKQMHKRVLHVTRNTPKKSSSIWPTFFQTQMYKYLLHSCFFLKKKIFSQLMYHPNLKMLTSAVVMHKIKRYDVLRTMFKTHKDLGNITKPLIKFMFRHVKL